MDQTPDGTGEPTTPAPHRPEPPTPPGPPRSTPSVPGSGPPPGGSAATPPPGSSPGPATLPPYAAPPPGADPAVGSPPHVDPPPGAGTAAGAPHHGMPPFTAPPPFPAPPGGVHHVGPPAPVPYGPPGVPAGGWLGAGHAADDLVTPPHAGFSGWWDRLTRVLGRTFWPVCGIMAAFQLLPTLLLMAVLHPFSGGLFTASRPLDAGEVALVPLLGLGLVGAVAMFFLAALSHAAGARLVVGRALGEPVTVGEALRYGARRMTGLAGWSALAALILLAALLLCVLPVFYALFALSLFAMVYLCEPGNPVARSWTLTHARFGAVLGRLALVAAAGLVVSGLATAVGGIVRAAAAGVGAPTPGGEHPGVAALATVVEQSLALPATVLLLVAVVLVYAEARAAEAPVTGGQLRAEMLRRAGA